MKLGPLTLHINSDAPTTKVTIITLFWDIVHDLRNVAAFAAAGLRIVSPADLIEAIRSAITNGLA